MDLENKIFSMNYYRLKAFQICFRPELSLINAREHYSKSTSIKFSDVIYHKNGDIFFLYGYNEKPIMDINFTGVPNRGTVLMMSSLDKEEPIKFINNLITSFNLNMQDYINTSGGSNAIRDGTETILEFMGKEIRTYETAKNLAIRYKESLDSYFGMIKYSKFLVGCGVSLEKSRKIAEKKFGLPAPFILH